MIKTIKKNKKEVLNHQQGVSLKKERNYHIDDRLKYINQG